MRRRKDEGPELAVREAWASACQLYEHLAFGGSLVALPPSAVRLSPDEVAYADAIVGCARFDGMNVTYERSSLLLLGSATFVAAGLAVNAMARPHPGSPSRSPTWCTGRAAYSWRRSLHWPRRWRSRSRSAGTPSAVSA